MSTTTSHTTPTAHHHTTATFQLEQLCLNISKSNGLDLCHHAQALGRLVRWNKTNRALVAKVGGLQSLTAAISSSARNGHLAAVTTCCDTLALLALDNGNKHILMDPVVQGGGCDILGIVRLCMYQLNQHDAGKHSSLSSQYIAPPTNAGVASSALVALAKLVWNVSTVDNAHELVGATRCGDGGSGGCGGIPSLLTLLISECMWCTDQIEACPTSTTLGGVGVAASQQQDPTRAVAWRHIFEARFQLLGALWSLSIGSEAWTDEQAMVWVPLLPTLLFVLEKCVAGGGGGNKNSAQHGTPSSEVARHHPLCLVLMGLIVHVLDSSVCCRCIVGLLQQQEEEDDGEEGHRNKKGKGTTGNNVFLKVQLCFREEQGGGGGGNSNQVRHLVWMALKKMSLQRKQATKEVREVEGGVEGVVKGVVEV